jgi:hypothetical protein
MSRYRAGSETARRKHMWMPCVISADFDGMTDEEKVRTLRETYWADNLTNSEWPVMLQDVRNAPVRSRLKKKMVGWFMILGRIGALNPELYNQAYAEARALYRKQLGEPWPLCREKDDDVADPVQQGGAE